MCQSIPDLISKTKEGCENDETLAQLHEKAKGVRDEFIDLLSLYGKVHRQINSVGYFDDEKITALGMRR